MRDDDARSAGKFDSEAPAYEARYLEHTPTGHSFRSRRRRAHDILGKRFLGKLLDAGGASGVYFHDFKNQVSEYHLIDISPKMIEAAKNIHAGDTPLYACVASVYDLPFDDATFDTILAMGLFEYLDSPWMGLRELARVAKPGASLVISFTNAHSPMRRLSKLLYKTAHKQDPFGRMFFLSEVEKAAGECGLVVCDVRGYNAQFFPFPLTWWLKPLAYGSAVILEGLVNRRCVLCGTSFIVELKK